LHQVGSPVGGNRAKALIAFNPSTGEVRSGQTAVPDGFEHWIIKFDGANEKSLGDSVGVGKVEYAYHLMALEAGIKMMPCRLFEENGRAHFMTKRFDRLPGNEKIHVQSLWALQHYDHSLAYEYCYEQVFNTILELRLGPESIQEMYRRMVFNIFARNQDDHTKNIAFMMNKTGSWQLTPAFDIVWQYKPKGLLIDYINNGCEPHGHQLSANGKWDDFTIADLEKVSESFGVHQAKDIRNQVADAVALWPKLAQKVGIKAEIIDYIKSTHRLDIIGKG
jgi:serine/threonine-protein kinase HipA